MLWGSTILRHSLILDHKQNSSDTMFKPSAWVARWFRSNFISRSGSPSDLRRHIFDKTMKEMEQDVLNGYDYFPSPRIFIDNVFLHDCFSGNSLHHGFLSNKSIFTSEPSGDTQRIKSFFASSFSAKNCGCFRRLMKGTSRKGTAAGGCLSFRRRMRSRGRRQKLFESKQDMAWWSRSWVSQTMGVGGG